MGIIEAIEITRDVAASNWHASDEERGAMNMVAELLAAYDALAPDWTQAPDWARWYAMDDDCSGYWYGSEPTFDALEGCWGAAKWQYAKLDDMGDLLVLLSPRLFCWQRPEPQP